MGTEGRESAAGKSARYWIYDALGISDEGVALFLQDATQLVVDQVSALAASLPEAVIAADPTEETIASLASFPRLEALARNYLTLFSVSERLLIGVLLASIAWGLRASSTRKPPSSLQVVNVELSDNELRQIVQQEVFKRQQKRP